PVLFAKQVSTLDALSGGRLLLGIGVGPNRHASEADTTKLGRHRTNLEKEYDIFGAVGPRGRRLEEYLQAAIAIWTEDRPSFHGEFVDFEEIDIFPKPVQKPYPPILIGGRSPEAKRRAAILGDGWNPSQIASTEIPPALEEIRAIRRAAGRDEELRFVGVNLHSIIASTDDEAEALVVPTIGHMFSDIAELRRRTLIGTIETFAQRALEYQAAGVNFIELKPVYRSVDHLVEQMRMIHEEVMPRMADD
ncbi:MAG: LLM class flavin-dependent oxidoreductase, partial [bacterium]